MIGSTIRFVEVGGTTPAGDRLDVAGAVDRAGAFPATLSGRVHSG
jgi:hypothetical protein